MLLLASLASATEIRLGQARRAEAIDHEQLAAKLVGSNPLRRDLGQGAGINARHVQTLEIIAAEHHATDKACRAVNPTNDLTVRVVAQNESR